MNLLLDTHTLLWWLADDPTLTDVATAVISDEDNVVYVSAATAWEISVKTSLGKLGAPENIVDAIRASEFETLAITAEHAVVAGAFPSLHRDPFDRMLVAQATIEQLSIVTRDPRIAEYEVATIPA